MVNIVERTLTKKFKSFWRQEREKKILDGKLDTYFSFKTDFYSEPYMDIQQFHLRKAMCNLRISAHNLLNVKLEDIQEKGLWLERKEFVGSVIY